MSASRLVYYHLKVLLRRRFRPGQPVFPHLPLRALDLNRWEWNALYGELEAALAVELDDATLQGATTVHDLVTRLSQQLRPTP